MTAFAIGLCAGNPLSADVKRRSEEGEKKNKNPISVPEVRAVSAKFVAGGSVEIELIAVVSSLRAVDFIIRKGPEHGTLSEIRRHPRENNRAIVTYTHRDTMAPTIDSFTYACRLDGGPFSAPGQVHLMGQKFDPILRVHSQPSFSRIFAGGEMEATAVIENVGSAPFDGHLKWEPPFDGPERLTIPAGAKHEMKVTFRPEKAGHFRWEMPLVGKRPDGVLEFYADSIPALTVSPGRMTLKWEEKTRERSAILTLSNGRPDEVTANLKLPSRLNGPKQVQLKPQGREDLKIFLSPQDVASFSEEIVVEAAGVTERVLVTAEAQPAELKWVSPNEKSLDFGTLAQRSEKEMAFSIGNGGGQDLLATITVRPPFSVQEAGETIRLGPGQERRFTMKIDTRAAGYFESNLEIAASSQKLLVKSRATVKAPDQPSPSPLASSHKKPLTGSKPYQGKRPLPGTAPAPPSAASSASASASTSTKIPLFDAKKAVDAEGKIQPSLTADAESNRKTLMAAVLASQGVQLKHLPTNPHLDQIQELRASDMTQSSLMLSWPQPKVNPANWRIEAASNGIKPEEGLIVKFWEPISNWSPAESPAQDGMVSVNIESLRPGAQYEFRVLGVDQEGKVSRPSPSIMVATLPAWRVPTWVWRTLIVAALGTVLYLLYRVKRGDFELEY